MTVRRLLYGVRVGQGQTLIICTTSSEAQQQHELDSILRTNQSTACKLRFTCENETLLNHNKQMQPGLALLTIVPLTATDTREEPR